MPFPSAPAGYSTGGRASEGLHRIFGVPAARGSRYVFQFLVPFPPPVSLGRDPVLPRVFLLLPRDHRRARRPAAPLLTCYLRRSRDLLPRIVVGRGARRLATPPTPRQPANRPARRTRLIARNAVRRIAVVVGPWSAPKGEFDCRP